MVVVADGTIDRYQLLWHERSIALHEYRVWLGNRSADQFSLVRMDVDCTLAQNQVMLQSITRPNPAAITNACSWSTINPRNNSCERAIFWKGLVRRSS